MRKYFKTIGEKILEEIDWNSFENSWNQLKEGEEKEIDFKVPLFKDHNHHLKPWEIDLEEFGKIKVGILQPIRKVYNTYPAKYPKKWDWIGNINVKILIEGNSDPKCTNTVLSFDFLKNFILTKDISRFIDEMISRLKKVYKDYLKQNYEKFFFPKKPLKNSLFLHIWRPSHRTVLENNRGTDYQRNHVIWVEFKMIKRPGEEKKIIFNYWTRRYDVLLRVLPTIPTYVDYLEKWDKRGKIISRNDIYYLKSFKPY